MLAREITGIFSIKPTAVSIAREDATRRTMSRIGEQDAYNAAQRPSIIH